MGLVSVHGGLKDQQHQNDQMVLQENIQDRITWRLVKVNLPPSVHQSSLQGCWFTDVKSAADGRIGHTLLYPNAVASFLMPNHLAGSTGSL